MSTSRDTCRSERDMSLGPEICRSGRHMSLGPDTCRSVRDMSLVARCVACSEISREHQDMLHAAVAASPGPSPGGHGSHPRMSCMSYGAIERCVTSSTYLG